MTVGNFSPFLGSLGDDPLVDSFFADDNNNNLQANSLEIVYGLPGEDGLTTNDLNFTSNDVAVLVNGDGGGQYLIRDNSTVVVFDNGNSGDDIIKASGISSVTNQFLTIDGGRHIYIFDLDTDTYLLLPDYREPANQIEFFGTGSNGSMLDYTQFTTEIDDAINNNDPGYLGDFSFAQVQNDPNIPEDARLDLASVGLSPDAVNEGLQKIAETANNFENTIASTDESIDGNLRSEDNSYIFNNESYFYDLYSVNQSVFDSGDLVKITLTSEDFDPLLFVLDSRGNVVEFDSNADGGDSELAFIVGSGEPLFVAVESSNAKATGDYNVTFDKVEVDISGVDRNETNIDDIPLIGIDTIQTTDSLTGSLTTEDLQVINTSEIFYQDNVLLVEGSVGDRVMVSLDSDFDAELSVSSIDPNGNINLVANVDNVIGAGVEQSDFTIQADLDYILTVDTFDPEVTGNYTLNTELI